MDPSNVDEYLRPLQRQEKAYKNCLKYLPSPVRVANNASSWRRRSRPLSWQMSLTHSRSTVIQKKRPDGRAARQTEDSDGDARQIEADIPGLVPDVTQHSTWGSKSAGRKSFQRHGPDSVRLPRKRRKKTKKNKKKKKLPAPRSSTSASGNPQYPAMALNAHHENSGCLVVRVVSDTVSQLHSLMRRVQAGLAAVLFS